MEYLKNGKFEARNAVPTISNAMDVGNPSNFVRIQDMFENNHMSILNTIYSKSFNDRETITKINEIYREYDYIIDPHGAVGYLAAEKYLAENDDNVNSIVLETAHPSKFMDVFNDKLNFTPEIPDRLASSLQKDGHSQRLSKNYNDFKNYLLS
jgi:threonine synthase